MNPAMLIALPGGLYVSGVVTWATRLANELVRRGHGAGLIVHRQRPGYQRTAPELDPRVRIFDLSALPAIEDCGGRLSEFVAGYLNALRAMRRPGGPPVVFSPNLHGECYGAAAALTQLVPEAVRLVGWCHLDSAYDRAVLSHYERCLSGLVGVSRETSRRLLEQRHDSEVWHIPYGVPVSAGEGERRGTRRRALRIVYMGRFDEAVKRVSAVLGMSDELAGRGVDHRLLMVGDGPVAGEVEAAASARRGRVRRLKAMSPEAAGALLSQGDVFVLASRAEGLSVAMLEAMGQGCVPVVSNVASGASDVIEHGVSGMLVDPGDEGLARRLAEAVHELVSGGRDLPAMSRAARGAAGSYSMEVHTDRVLALMHHVVQAGAKPWPAGSSTAFTNAGGGSATVPGHAADRMREALTLLRGERVVIHGAGRHTVELAGVLAEFRGEVAGITDDDPCKHGARIGAWTVSAPPGPEGATAVVVSSFIHQEEMLRRCGVYEGMRLVTLYPKAFERGVKRFNPRSASTAR